MGFFLEITLNSLDNYLESWFKALKPAGGVARCSTYLFPMRSHGSHPPFRGFPLSTVSPFPPRIVPRQKSIGLSLCGGSFVNPPSRSQRVFCCCGEKEFGSIATDQNT